MSKKLMMMNKKFEKIVYSDLTDEQKSREYAKLMTEMEKQFNIPFLRDPDWEKENKPVVALYRIISASRSL